MPAGALGDSQRQQTQKQIEEDVQNKPDFSIPGKPHIPQRYSLFLFKLKSTFLTCAFLIGEPRVVEYHMMNNRRFVLTRDESNLV